MGEGWLLIQQSALGSAQEVGKTSKLSRFKRKALEAKRSRDRNPGEVVTAVSMGYRHLCKR